MGKRASITGHESPLSHTSTKTGAASVKLEPDAAASNNANAASTPHEPAKAAEPWTASLAQTASWRKWLRGRRNRCAVACVQGSLTGIRGSDEITADLRLRADGAAAD